MYYKQQDEEYIEAPEVDELLVIVNNIINFDGETGVAVQLDALNTVLAKFDEDA